MNPTVDNEYIGDFLLADNAGVLDLHDAGHGGGALPRRLLPARLPGKGRAAQPRRALLHLPGHARRRRLQRAQVLRDQDQLPVSLLGLRDSF